MKAVTWASAPTATRRGTFPNTGPTPDCCSRAGGSLVEGRGERLAQCVDDPGRQKNAAQEEEEQRLDDSHRGTWVDSFGSKDPIEALVLVPPCNRGFEGPIGRASVVQRNAAPLGKHKTAADNLSDGPEGCCERWIAHRLSIGRNPESEASPLATGLRGCEYALAA
jgi:hypothetical protein